MKIMFADRRLNLGWLAVAAVALSLGLAGCGNQVATQPVVENVPPSTPNQIVASDSDVSVEVNVPETEESTEQVTPASEPVQAETTASDEVELDDPKLKTFATLGLYHLLATLSPDFELGTTVSVEEFEPLIEERIADLGYLLKSSYGLAAELTECLDEGVMIREEVMFMIVDAVQGELAEEYPSVLKDVGRFLGAPKVYAAEDIAEDFTKNFLQEMSIEGGVCLELSTLVDIDCTIFKALPDL